MKIFSSTQVKEIDRYTIANEPVDSTSLMFRAAMQCALWLMKNYTRNQKFKIFAGCGNNGGDGLAIARILLENDYKAEVHIIKIAKKLSPDAQYYFELLRNTKGFFIQEVDKNKQLPQIHRDDIVIDALFGSGLNRSVETLAAETINYLNSFDAEKVAIDIPSGLMTEGISTGVTVFKAKHTLTFRFPYLSFFFAENSEFVGNYHVLNIGLHPAIIQELKTHYILTESSDIKIKARGEFAHKGTFGHALIVAGSKGMAGAAVLSAKACLRSGCGLVTVHSSPMVTHIVQSSFPEAITSIDKSENAPSQLPDLAKYSAVAIGPGIGISAETKNLMIQLFKEINQPLILDADALNVISQDKQLLHLIPSKAIITPHPGEFDRLFGESKNSFERLQKQLKASIELGIIIVLKGKYTSVSLPDGTCYFNPTGNSGMAAAGCGDVLTGIICSLLSQGYETEQAAITGVYLHGLAGDVAAETLGKEYLIASDIIHGLSKAFKKIKNQ